MAIALKELKRVLQTRVRRAGGVRALGRELGVIPSRISEAMKDGVEPQPHLVAALGYRKASAMYERVQP